MITYVKGDLIASAPYFHAIAHGCNAQGVMGSGIAKQIRETFPEAYKAYRARYMEGGLTLGSFNRSMNTPWTTPWVFNLITQEYYGRESKRYADPDAIRESLREAMVQLIDEFDWEVSSIGLPLIGCGLGGLDWHTDVRPIYEELDYELGIRMVVFEEYEPGVIVKPPYPDLVCCIRDERGDEYENGERTYENKKSLCGKSTTYKFSFVDVRHAYNTAHRQDRLEICPECSASLVQTLKEGTWKEHYSE